ncbi:MAG: YihY/virulence factor BrkB family protein [Rhodobacter sp.]|nr:YihY/virulence factor BrkB family protein [Rhodobacter sp.]
MRLRLCWRVLHGVWRLMGERDLDLIAAGVAFYAMLSVFPAVAAVIALWGFVADPAVIESQLDLLRPLIPAEVFAIIDGQTSALIGSNNSTLGLATLISTAVAIWTARAGVDALKRGLNAAYGTQPRSGISGFLVSLLLTFALVGIALVALASIVVAPLILAFFPDFLLGGNTMVVVRWAVTVAVVMGGLGVIYRYGPNHRGPRPDWISPGAVIAILLWAAASTGLSTYLANFANYNEVYGSIGAVIALLLWLFLSALSVLLGAAVNSELEDAV